jgi:hypothetical protein
MSAGLGASARDEQGHRADDREDDDDPIEQPLVDAPSEGAADERSGENDRDEQEEVNAPCGVMSPSPNENGSFATLTTAKNHADVPRNAWTGKRAAMKYIDITGPAALATIVVNPARPP